MNEHRWPTILLVDNNAEIGAVVGDVLAMYHLRVVVCVDSTLAQGLIVDLQPDLLILDVDMPDLDGVTLFTRVRDAGITVPVIFFTGNPDLVKTRLVVYKARGAVIIVKPRVDHLPQMVLQTLAYDPAA